MRGVDSGGGGSCEDKGEEKLYEVRDEEMRSILLKLFRGSRNTMNL